LRNYMNLRRYLQAFFSRKVDLVTYGSLSPHIRPFVDREVIWVG
jgi:predicted nucleotidyltransferase